MSVTPNLQSIADLPSRRPVSQAWTARKSRIPTATPKPLPEMRKARITRRFEIEYLLDGDITSDVMVAPALPAFEQAFAAFTHGVLIQTSEGPVAVEDLYPGMMLDCGDGRMSQLQWKGAINIVPGAPTLNDEPDKLYRVTSDAFGLARPVQDQIFGPHARRLDRDAKIRATIGSDAALVPLSAMKDGHSVIEVSPVAPTRVYHLVCEGHETILAAGLEVESYHPGTELPLSLPEEMIQMFMRFFPHMTSIRDFGRLAHPRVSAEDMELLA